MRLPAALKAAFSLLFAMSAVLSAGPEFKRYEQIAPAVPLYGPPDTVSMFVIGDVMLHSKQMEYPYTQFLAGIKGLMQSARGGEENHTGEYYAIQCVFSHKITEF